MHTHVLVGSVRYCDRHAATEKEENGKMASPTCCTNGEIRHALMPFNCYFILYDVTYILVTKLAKIFYICDATNIV